MYVTSMLFRMCSSVVHIYALAAAGAKNASTVRSGFAGWICGIPTIFPGSRRFSRLDTGASVRGDDVGVIVRVITKATLNFDVLSKCETFCTTTARSTINSDDDHSSHFWLHSVCYHILVSVDRNAFCKRFQN